MEITAEKVIKAYEETGLKPVYRGFCGVIESGDSEIGCGCALTAIYVHETKRDIKKIDDVSEITTYFQREYEIDPTSFYNGYDNNSFVEPEHYDEDLFNLGYDVREEVEDYFDSKGIDIVDWERLTDDHQVISEAL
jgi:hypothetical protein